MKLLYVSMTRALHELNVLYSKELVKPLKLDVIEPVLVKGKAKPEDYKKIDEMLRKKRRLFKK